MRTVTQVIEDLGINRTQFYQLMEELEIKTIDQGKSKLIDEENYKKLKEEATNKFLNIKLKKYENKIREYELKLEESRIIFEKKLQSMEQNIKLLEAETNAKDQALERNYIANEMLEKGIEKRYVSEIQSLKEKLNVHLEENKKNLAKLAFLEKQNYEFKIYKETNSDFQSEIKILKEQNEKFHQENQKLRNQILKNENTSSELENQKRTIEKMLSLYKENLESAQKDKEKLFEILQSQSKNRAVFDQEKEESN